MPLEQPHWAMHATRTLWLPQKRRRSAKPAQGSVSACICTMRTRCCKRTFRPSVAWFAFKRLRLSNSQTCRSLYHYNLQDISYHMYHTCWTVNMSQFMLPPVLLLPFYWLPSVTPAVLWLLKNPVHLRLLALQAPFLCVLTWMTWLPGYLHVSSLSKQNLTIAMSKKIYAISR